MSDNTTASEYFARTKFIGAGARMCTPAYERLKHLHALGHSYAEMCECLNQEFADVAYTPITLRMVRMLYEENREDFEKTRMELGLKCREEIQNQVAILFNRTENVECEMVDVYVLKMKSALAQLRDLDLDERDDSGNYKNTSRIFVLIEMVDKLQSKVSKIVGTDALREIEIFRQKAAARAEAENNKANLLPPPARGRTLDSQPDTNFI